VPYPGHDPDVDGVSPAPLPVHPVHPDHWVPILLELALAADDHEQALRAADAIQAGWAGLSYPVRFALEQRLHLLAQLGEGLHVDALVNEALGVLVAP